jgi:cyclopropane-fatty-acyl-phospholipid synthase
MPSEGLLGNYQEHVRLAQQWRWSGTHYEKTANAWLENLDRAREDLMPLFRSIYGRPNAALWFQRWRIFFMACAELWGFRGGAEWHVAHYLFEKQRRRVATMPGDAAANTRRVQAAA